jgi:hypothetical protein
MHFDCFSLCLGFPDASSIPYGFIRTDVGSILDIFFADFGDRFDIQTCTSRTLFSHVRDRPVHVYVYAFVLYFAIR